MGILPDWARRPALAAVLVGSGLSVSGSLYAFGPVLLGIWLGGNDTSETVLKQNQTAIEQNSEALRALIEALGDVRNVPAAPAAPGPPAAPAPPRDEVAVPESPAIEAAPAPRPIEPEPAEPAPDTPAAIPPPQTIPAASSPTVFGVFEQQPFDLCGYRGFTARIASGNSIVIASEDRSIPDRKFRGYERSLPVEQLVELWSGCTVGAAYSSANGTKRIVFSIAGKG